MSTRIAKLQTIVYIVSFWGPKRQEYLKYGFLLRVRGAKIGSFELYPFLGLAGIRFFFSRGGLDQPQKHKNTSHYSTIAPQQNRGVEVD